MQRTCRLGPDGQRQSPHGSAKRNRLRRGAWTEDAEAWLLIGRKVDDDAHGAIRQHPLPHRHCRPRWSRGRSSPDRPRDRGLPGRQAIWMQSGPVPVSGPGPASPGRLTNSRSMVSASLVRLASGRCGEQGARIDMPRAYETHEHDRNTIHRRREVSARLRLLGIPPVSGPPALWPFRRREMAGSGQLACGRSVPSPSADAGGDTAPESAGAPVLHRAGHQISFSASLETEAIAA
jgi:hypothetical protein